MASPTDVSNLNAWWRSKSLSMTSGTTVDSWPDSSGNGFNATQSTALKQPEFRTNQINGLPALRFDGGDGLISSAPSSLTETTVIAVGRPETVSGADRSIRSSLGGGGGLNVRIRGSKLGVGTNSVAPGEGTVNVPINVFGIYTHTFSDVGNAVSYYRNGTFEVARTTTMALTPGRTTSIGEEPGNSTRFWQGDLAEIIIYSKVLTQVERSMVHSYLQDEYNIAVADYVPSLSQTWLPFFG